jgi:hypothetical protein
MAQRPAGGGSDAAAQAWAGKYIVTSMLTGVVSTFGACQTFFVMVVSLLGGDRRRCRPPDLVPDAGFGEFSLP